MTKSELKKSLKPIFAKIKDPVYRWDGLLELKQLELKQFKDILAYAKHPFWLISWAILDKIADFDDEKAIPYLFPFIKHNDSQIKQKAEEVIISISTNNVMYFIKKLDHLDYRVRFFAITVLKEKGPNIITFLSSQVGKHSWVISNRLVQIIWEIVGMKKATILIPFLTIHTVQRHTIMLMALSKNKDCIKPIVRLYKYPRLKQHIMLAINSFGVNDAIPAIIETLKDIKAKKWATSLLKRIGSPAVPYLIKASISKSDHYKDIMALLELIPFTMNQYITLEEKFVEKRNTFKHLDPIRRFEPKIK